MVLSHAQTSGKELGKLCGGVPRPTDTPGTLSVLCPVSLSQIVCIIIVAMSKRKLEGEKEKVVLAYSGGLDTSVILVWLVQKGT